MYNSEQLLKQIEKVRNRMTDVALTKGITSIESITLSQELDRLLNRYNEMMANDRSKYHEQGRGGS
ncbi:Spo0E like sporulation regulatory protein [Oceanobacillus limi]|uniref:Spo0E like sporulation regulatory protein n=1 Tax=Oceanobacillus limi TaxID=930131 RepID=A0A1I0DA99_9BACI|nr:aspartyl-phosphate phosphatase Spo0E family protein [Oceanobacillus limi]SET28606.1 Spo0E like sporulation regulatory protein [Oceanobacillus limi]